MKMYRIRRQDNRELLSSFRRKDEQREDWDWCNQDGSKAYEDQTTFEFFFCRNESKAWETDSETEADVMRAFFNYFTLYSCELDVREVEVGKAPF